MDRAVFYDDIRHSLFGGQLTQAQVDGIDGLLDAFAETGEDIEILAYGLATAYHETGRRMVPVREGFAKTDAEARRSVKRLARKRGYASAVAKYSRPCGPYGHVYYGRGHVQLTWQSNYAASSDDAGVDLEKNPDAMLDPTVSARVLFAGLLDGRWNKFGIGVEEYITAKDIRGARRTVNGLDKADLVAGYYSRFLDACHAAEAAG